MNSIAKYIGISQIQVDLQDFFLVSSGSPSKAKRSRKDLTLQLREEWQEPDEASGLYSSRLVFRISPQCWGQTRKVYVLTGKSTGQSQAGGIQYGWGQYRVGWDLEKQRRGVYIQGLFSYKYQVCWKTTLLLTQSIVNAQRYTCACLLCAFVFSSLYYKSDNQVELTNL